MWNKEYTYVTQANVRDLTLTDVFSSDILGFDVECTSLNPHDGKLLTLQLATPRGTYVYDARRLDLTPLGEGLKDYAGTVVAQNGSFDLKWFYKTFGYWWTTPKFFDTFHAHRLKNVGFAKTYKEKFLGLDALVAGYLQYEMNKEIRDSFQYVDEDELTEQQIHYAAEDAAVLLPLYEKMLPKLKGRQSDFIIDLEMSLLPVTASMEYWGIPIDTMLWHSIATEKEIERDINKTLFVDLMREYGWEDINPNSWQQLKKAFNEDLGIAINDTTLDTFKDNKHRAPDIIEPLIRYKELKQPTTTFGKKWLRHVTENGNVYATFNQLGTDTGRYCVSPDTLVAAPRDYSKYPDGIPLSELEVGDWVYSLTWDKRLCLKQILWVGPTKIAPALHIAVKDRWGNVTDFTLSKDHLVRLYTGKWINAGNLKIGDRLAGMPKISADDGYRYMFPSSTRRKRGESGGKCKEHRWIYAQIHGMPNLPAKWDVHHLDENKINNHPDNLELIYHASHMKMHRNKTSPEQVQYWLDNPNKCKIHKKSLRRLAKEYGLVATNHTIIAIEDVPEIQLWDLEVADTHTFYGGNVALHNSSDSPNLQNIPVRDDPRYREAFIAREDSVVITADLSQIEYRIAGELSGSKVIIDEYNKATPDFHQLTATQAGAVLGHDIERALGKTMNFALIYRAGPGRLIRLLGCDMATAKSLHSAYWAGYPQLNSFMQREGITARIRGYSETKLGRRRYFSAPNDAPRWMLNELERQGGNMPIQGSAADILKVATLKMFPEFNRIGAKLISQVHDEVVVDVKDDPAVIEEAKHIIDISMKYAGGLVLEQVPVMTDFVISKHWSK